MKIKSKLKRVIAAVMAEGMTLSLIPSITTYAAQSNEYIDPAENWLEANGRTGEFDINATVTTGTAYCPICEMDTGNTCYRVPEYTRTGETAYNRGVYYSDGTLIDGNGKGNLDDGTPGVDAFYTGYHWTKSICQNCGTINSVDGINAYSCGKDVYSLNPCDSNFFLDFDNTEYVPYNSTKHTTKLKKGKYCQFCKGTYERYTDKQENHNFDEVIDGELGNQRFHITADCEDCGYKKNEYAAAKSVVQSYYGKVHTVTVSDLSESGVHTSIRYGTEANKCTKTSAPNYTDEGYYPVYYEIDYTYGGESMTENGVSYVWLLADNSNISTNSVHTHDYRFLETVRPNCTELGYDRFQCNECGALQKTNYTPASGHDYNVVVIREPSCQQGGLELHSCTKCGSYYTESTSMTGHKYETNIVASTCTKNGYTEHICIDCGYKYITDLTQLARHDYRTTVTEPGCKTKGYTTYQCRNCDDTYVNDYTEPRGHKWDSGHTVTNSTCESEGVKEFHCKHCDEKMIQAISATGHTAGKAATCTEPQTCESCGAILELPTGHTYSETVTKPTCTAMGFTTFTCKNCGETYRADEVSAKGHKPSEWIVDVAATIENEGSKYIECTECKTVLKSDIIPQLIDKDNSDEDGKSTVGDYSILITDKDGKPVFDSEITIDKDDNISIKLPDGRLLDYEDRTTITVTHKDTKDAAADLNINISDKAGNAATGKTDEGGQLVVPNNQSSTGDENGTIGGDNGENKYTYVVTVTDKNDMIISDCDIHIGDNHDIVVKLPDGTAMNSDNRVTVTVKDHNGEAQENVNVIIIGDSDYIEKGVTNANRQVTLPTKNQAYTDKNGTANVNGYIVFVEDETEPIYAALVTVDDNGVMVCLPNGKKIDYHNRTSVTVKKSDGEAVEDISVNFYDNIGGDRTEKTDKDGKVTIPPLNENIIEDIPTPTPEPSIKPGLETPEPSEQPSGTDEPTTTEQPIETDKPTETEKPTPTINPDNGSEVITPDYSYKVSVIDNDGVIHGAIVSVDKDSGSVTVKLPDEKAITPDNRIIVGITDTDGKAVNGVPVTVIAKDGTDAKDLTNSEGIAVVPPTNTDRTDKNGYAQIVEGESVYNIVVEDTKAKIENAAVEVKDGKISVILPDGNKLNADNQTTITVTDKDNTAVKDISVTVTDKDNKTATKSTDANGKITVPVKVSTGGSSGGGGGSSSGGGSGYVKPSYTVKVVDKDGKTVNVNKTVKDDKITLTLPNDKTLDDNYYTITVTDNKGKTAEDIDVTLKDKTNSVSGTTDANGQLIMPTNTHNSYVVGYEDGSFKPDGNMTRAEAAAIFARNIAERKGETISSRKSSFKDVSSKDWYNNYIAYLEKYKVISGYDNKTFKPNEQITRAEFVTMCMRFYELNSRVAASKKNIFNDVPKSHWASSYIYSAVGMGWINGYSDKTFKPDSNITRAEVVTIVNRVTGRAADTEYINKNMSAVNKFTDLKDKSYWAFYEIFEASNTHKTVDGANGETWVK